MFCITIFSNGSRKTIKKSPYRSSRAIRRSVELKRFAFTFADAINSSRRRINRAATSMNNIGRRCAGRSAFVSQDQRRYIRAAEHIPRSQRIIGGKNQRVSRAINRRGRRSHAIDLRQNDAWDPYSERKADERARSRSG